MFLSNKFFGSICFRFQVCPPSHSSPHIGIAQQTIFWSFKLLSLMVNVSYCQFNSTKFWKWSVIHFWNYISLFCLFLSATRTRIAIKDNFLWLIVLCFLEKCQLIHQTFLVVVTTATIKTFSPPFFARISWPNRSRTQRGRQSYHWLGSAQS